jgi:mercuric ion transport protein
LNKANISSIGTILTSLIATSCCIGPAIFIIFGTSVGFISKLSFLMPIQPYLLGVAFVMLGYSFWKLYINKSDCTCEADIGVRKIARGIFWIGFIALVFAASFQKVVLWIYG